MTRLTSKRARSDQIEERIDEPQPHKQWIVKSQLNQVAEFVHDNWHLCITGSFCKACTVDKQFEWSSQGLRMLLSCKISHCKFLDVCCLHLADGLLHLLGMMH